MWTGPSITSLRLKLGMTPFQFAKKLGVSVAEVEMWERGVPVPPFDQGKLDNLESQSSGYLRDKARLAETIRKNEADKQKSEYVTELLPNFAGSVSVKRK